MATDIQFNVDQALAKLGELAAKHGPQAVDVAAQVERISAIGQLVVSGAVLLVAGAFAIASFKMCYPRWQAGRRAWAEYMADHTGRVSHPSDDGFGWLMAMIVPNTFTTFAALAFGFSGLLDVWAWVALYDPKLALAHHVLQKFAGL